jgi:hypothetical protein
MNKIDDLMERLERVKLAQTDETPDGLSTSLWALGAELIALDDDGVAVMADKLGIAPDDVREMGRTYAR